MEAAIDDRNHARSMKNAARTLIRKARRHAVTLLAGLLGLSANLAFAAQN
ncbi:MAG TPA: hypothetical protein VF472_01345 [Burkholderiaceae bacterium]